MYTRYIIGVSRQPIIGRLQLKHLLVKNEKDNTCVNRVNNEYKKIYRFDLRIEIEGFKRFWA